MCLDRYMLKRGQRPALRGKMLLKEEKRSVGGFLQDGGHGDMGLNSLAKSRPIRDNMLCLLLLLSSRRIPKKKKKREKAVVYCKQQVNFE